MPVAVISRNFVKHQVTSILFAVMTSCAQESSCPSDDARQCVSWLLDGLTDPVFRIQTLLALGLASRFRRTPVRASSDSCVAEDHGAVAPRPIEWITTASSA